MTPGPTRTVRRSRSRSEIWRLYFAKSMTSASGNDGDARLGGGFDDGAGLAGASRKGDRDGFDAINRGIGRIKLTGQVVERNGAIGTDQRGLLLSGNHLAPNQVIGGARD